MIFILDDRRLTIDTILNEAKALKKTQGIQLLIIDSLDMIASNKVCMILKELALELNIPILVLSGLSRRLEIRGGDKRPQLSDLKCSDLEKYADLNILLYRSFYYGITEDEFGLPTYNLAELIIAKNNNSILGGIPLKYIGLYAEFTN